MKKRQVVWRRTRLPLTTSGAENEVGGSGEKVIQGLGRRGRRKLGDEIMKIIEGGDRAESPFEIRHNPEFHSLNRFGLEDELGLKQLQVQ